MTQKRISTQDIANILLEEIAKIESHTKAIKGTEEQFRTNLLEFKETQKHYIHHINNIFNRKLKIDTIQVSDIITHSVLNPILAKTEIIHKENRLLKQAISLAITINLISTIFIAITLIYILL